MEPPDPIYSNPDDPFYEIEAVENAPRIAIHELLTRRGVVVPPPDELTENALNSKLWEIIYTLAASHVFLHSTDHLSDREFYTLLRDKLLPEETTDLSFHYASNIHFDLLEFSDDNQSYLYLKYYADEDERKLWAANMPANEIPDRINTPFARDRYLPHPCPPDPKKQKVDPQFEDDETHPASEQSPDAPARLESKEREIRIERRPAGVNGSPENGWNGSASPVAGHGQNGSSQQSVQRLEIDGWYRAFDKLTTEGFDLPAPESLGDAELSLKLKALVQELARHGFFLHHTDHLNNRQLYQYLWNEGLQEEIVPGSAWHHDLIGNGSVESIHTWLRYYATEEERHHWEQDNPDELMPPRELPPFDRDRDLPKGA